MAESGRMLHASLRTIAPAWKPVVAVGVLAFAMHGRSPAVPHNPASPQDAIARSLASEGLEALAEDVVLVDRSTSLVDTIRGGSRSLVRANVKGESQHDIYLVRTRQSPEGSVISLESVHPLTNTGVDETRPVVVGEFAAFATIANGVATGIELYDLRSEDPHTTDGWTGLQRAQNAITNWQKTGNRKGVERKRYTLEPQAAGIAYAFQNGLLVVDADSRKIIVNPAADQPIEGSGFARFERAAKGRPGDMVTWAVDRVRAVKWLGPEFIAILEHYAFQARDYYKRKIKTTTTEDTVAEVKDDLGGARIKPTFTDPEIGFPPAPLTPTLKPALPNEGVWLGTDDDPFVGKNPGVPAAFVQTWLRTDGSRPYARVYVTLWDPRQVALHMAAGTTEPVSATGEVGTGQIPRTPETLKNLVAGFNGGFQAVHFEGGMQVSGSLYLPPKPYAGTIAELRDGTTAIGVWPDQKSEVPDEILSFRQNLVPLVLNDIVNPYKLLKWGGTAGGSDNIHTTRSGVCITKEGFVAYFFGNDMSPETLGLGMVATRCKVAVHLDMNAGHTGFEFYRVAPTGELPDLMRPFQSDWEAENRVPNLDGWSFRARRMVKGMPHMLFPRYIGRDARDFMYLTLRSVLPGHPIVPRITPAEPGEGTWKLKGLPQHGFPYAVAVSAVRPDPKNPAVRAQILKVDPRSVRVAPANSVDDPKAVLSFGGLPETPTKSAGLSLWLSTGSFVIGTSSPGPSAALLFAGEEPTPAALNVAQALVGITDDDGTLVYVTADSAAGNTLKALLGQLGCSQIMVVPTTLEPRFGGGLDLRGELAVKPLAGRAVTLVRGEAPSARQLFPDTTVVPPSIWQPLQSKRVRYFGKRPRILIPPEPTSH